MLLFVIAYFGGFPRVLVVALGIAAVVAIAVCLGGGLLAGVTGRWLGTVLHRMFKEAALRSARKACATAAAALDGLLDRHDLKPRHAIVTEFFHGRHILAGYSDDLRETVEDAVSQARSVVTVPPTIVRCAAKPRNVADLEFLRDWLRRIADSSAGS